MKKMSSNSLDLYVGSRLRVRRKMLGLSLRNLAKELKVTYQQVQKYETGKNRMGAGTLYQLSKLFNVEVTYFFEGYDNYVASSPPVKTTSSFQQNHEVISLFSNLPAPIQKNLIRLMQSMQNIETIDKEAM